MMNEIKSVFTVTNYKTGAQSEIVVDGCGQEAAVKAMSMYQRHTKFVLNGFEIDGNYVPLYIKSR